MMKKSFIAVLGLAILGACTTSQDVVSNKLISKRKYNKGVHVNMSFKKYGTTKGVQEDKILMNEEVAVINNKETYVYEPVVVIQSNESIVNDIINTTNDVVSNEVVEKVYVASKAKEVVTSNENSKADFKTVKAELKAKKAEFKKVSNKMDDELIALLLCIFVFPPLGVWFYEGKTWTKRCTNNLLWTLLCGLPGLIHGLMIILGKK
jgi:uncharacterized membrane protein YqaE (UPF0057 family)